VTPFSKRCEILGDLWLQYRDDEGFQDFVEYNDLGLPLAYALREEIVHLAPVAENLVNETFDLLISSIGIEDSGFESLDEILAQSIEE
jgi:hypothetical protein